VLAASIIRAMMMEAASTFETLVNYRTAWCMVQHPTRQTSSYSPLQEPESFHVSCGLILHFFNDAVPGVEII
jgi:hypothetical protein